MKKHLLSLFLILPLVLSSCRQASNISTNSNSQSSSELENTYTIHSELENTYTIQFDLNGGRSNSYQGSKTVDTFSKDIFFFDCVKEGYNFRGWSYEGKQIFDEYGNQLVEPYMQSEMTFVAMYAKNVKLTISMNIPDAGVVTGEGTYEFNSYVDVYAKPLDNNRFIGWYNKGGKPLSESQNYRYMMSDKDVTLEARFAYPSFNLNIYSNNSTYGLVCIKNNYAQCEYNSSYSVDFYYKSKVTVAAYSKTDVRFLGWYDKDNILVSSNAVYDFIMPAENYELEAKWNYFEITYNLNGGTNSENNPSYYTIDDSAITLHNPIREGCIFKGWKYEDQFITSIDPNLAKDITLNAVWKLHDTLTFGIYPQTRVSNTTLLAQLNTLTTTESNGYFLYNGSYYAKKSASTFNIDYTFSDGTKIVDGTTYWFKCEPIKWDILSISNGKYSLVSTFLLDAHRYNEYYDGTKNGYYANNYKNSEIRSWLNNEFYNSAFSLDSSSIQTTLVDNSASTTDSSTNVYACENTNDKVYLLSYQDCKNTTYFPDDESRFCQPTDYARAKGVCGHWYWTRSPLSSGYSGYASFVRSDGSLYNIRNVSSANIGVRPAMIIEI